MKKTNILLAIASIFTLTLALAVTPLQTVFAAVGDVDVTVKSELGYPIQGAGVYIWCTGGATTTIVGLTDAAGLITIATSTGLAPGGDYDAASCDENDILNIVATSSVYVSGNSFGNTYSALATNAVTATSSYTLKVTALENELGTDIMPTSGTPFASTSPAVGAITVASSTYSDSAWYLAATSSPTGGTLAVTVAGYVQGTIASVITSSSAQRTVAFDGGSGATYNGDGLLYALKVMVQSLVPLSGVTVGAGESFGVSCSESGSTGTYYCVIPAGDTGTTVQVSKTGFTTNTGPYASRSSNSDAQSTLTISMASASSATEVTTTSTAGSAGWASSYVPFVAPTYPNTAPVLPNIDQIKFSRDLSLGIRGADVKVLQTLLNSKGYTLSTSGPGSPGNETEFFGRLTQQAMARFQRDNNITPSVGYFGPKTRAFVETMR